MQVEAIAADITTLATDVVVNAANEHLTHGGGVASAIARAGTPVVDEESRAWIRANGPIGPGEAAHTGAGPMPAKWVVHVVGPRYNAARDNAGLLRQAVSAALDAAVELGARSVAMPAISAGIFGYPRREATGVIAAEVLSWADAHPDALERVILVGYDEATASDFAAALT